MIYASQAIASALPLDFHHAADPHKVILAKAGMDGAALWWIPGRTSAAEDVETRDAMTARKWIRYRFLLFEMTEAYWSKGGSTRCLVSEESCGIGSSEALAILAAFL